MINVKELTYFFPQKDLYHDISFTIENGQHCVLIGSNGTGKTTLLDLLIHRKDYLYDGEITLPDNCRFGYVNQLVKHEKERDITVFDYLCEDFLQMQGEMDALCAEMETAEDYEAVMERYQQAMDEFDAIDGYSYEVNIRRQLKLAGLSALEQTKVAAISGGEYKLLQVIRQMLRVPTLLIMDEPDVFLDFENLNGLRDLINAHKGTMLVVTHNRYLLNHCFDKVLHIENEGLREFEGSYLDYTFALLQMKVELQEAAAKDAEWIEYQNGVVDRLRERATLIDSTANGKALRARISYLERLQETRTRKPFLESRRPAITLPQPKPVETEPEWVLKVEDYGVAFDDQLLDHVSFTLAPHDKVALVGPNGTGKTTLLRDIWRNASPAIQRDPETEVAFLSQLYGEMLDESQTLYDTFDDMGALSTIEDYLSGYCFTPREMKEPVGKLSGGEKNLLQLAKIARGQAGLLLLDEPTSHLDIHAQGALEEAVNAYHGAVLMVSHDFYSIANCVDYVLFVDGGTVRRMSARAFRKLIYKNHFDRDYLELEQRKKELENKITSLLKADDYQTAKTLCEELESVVRKMQ